MFDDLIGYKDLHEACAESFGFGEVTFKRDFGPWKHGDKVEVMWFDIETSTAKEVSQDGTDIKTYKFKLT